MKRIISFLIVLCVLVGFTFASPISFKSVHKTMYSDEEVTCKSAYIGYDLVDFYYTYSKYNYECAYTIDDLLFIKSEIDNIKSGTRKYSGKILSSKNGNMHFQNPNFLSLSITSSEDEYFVSELNDVEFTLSPDGTGKIKFLRQYKPNDYSSIGTNFIISLNDFESVIANATSCKAKNKVDNLGTLLCKATDYYANELKNKRSNLKVGYEKRLKDLEIQNKCDEFIKSHKLDIGQSALYYVFNSIDEIKEFSSLMKAAYGKTVNVPSKFYPNENSINSIYRRLRLYFLENNPEAENIHNSLISKGIRYIMNYDYRVIVDIVDGSDDSEDNNAFFNQNLEYDKILKQWNGTEGQQIDDNNITNGVNDIANDVTDTVGDIKNTVNDVKSTVDKAKNKLNKLKKFI